MSLLYDRNVPKRATNLSVNADLLAKAKTLNINLSAVLEKALVEAVRQKKRAGWVAENADAITIYNDQIDQIGLFSDDVRAF